MVRENVRNYLPEIAKKMHLKPTCGNYLNVIHFNLPGMFIKYSMDGENFQNYLLEIAKNELKTTLWELFESYSS